MCQKPILEAGREGVTRSPLPHTSAERIATPRALLGRLALLEASPTLHHQSPAHLHHSLRMGNGFRPVGDQDAG
jgi:hypothetical protein